ncbi:MAG: SMP-30/gluconolactonase/LRE family protein [Ilumatobacteraceae bacterium]
MITTATTAAYGLAEAPYWDARRQLVLWVDIVGCRVIEGALQPDGTIAETGCHEFDCMVSAVVATLDGTLLVAAQEELICIDPNGERRVGPRVVPAGSGRRMNDGAVDPEGRFVVGTLKFGGGSSSETLVRVERDSSITVLDDDLTLSNGIAWSTDSTRMYTVDTRRQVVYRRTDDHARQVHLRVEDGYPDGIAVDADDHLWVAIWGAGEVRRFRPDGTLAERVDVPAPHTSSIAFAGDDLRTMVITTAFDELTDNERAEFPLSGRLFTLRTRVAGLAPTPWKEFPCD